MPALQALLQLDPGMLWWRRLFAVAAFKAAALEAAAAGGGGQGAFAAALPPEWRGARAPAVAWQAAGAAAATRALLESSDRAFAALLGLPAAPGGGGPEAVAELRAAAGAWLERAGC